ncbi:MAG: ATP-binding cassette domain-containing protein, partial [Alkaliphilus sp.]
VEKILANDIIKSLPKGLDSQLGTWFGEGVQLSGGEWQKIALARVFFNDADCYILDEPTSSLDPAAEHKVLLSMLELCKEKISIFVSHRLHNLSKLETRIIVLKEGRIVEEGTHESLVKANGHYKYLYTLKNKE